MDNTREKVYLAALLHDIGKFYQRADKPLSDKQNELSEESKKIADLICPLTNSGNFGYQHCIWTHQFLQDKENVFKNVPNLIDNKFDTTSENTFYRLSSFHHKPSTELEALISMADWWSAGIDRRESLEQESGSTNNVDWGKSRYKKIPLYSVFNGIFKKNYHYAFGLRKLSIDEKDFFPKNIASVSDGIKENEYSKLWDSFTEEFNLLPTDSFEGFAESLMFILKKYTWCIPSNTTDMANVSLFDHLKTTAAFADCLYIYKQEQPDDFVFSNNRLTIKEDAKPVVLVGGDLSGIQKFIYNIASRKAAVSLKGRSFYLQLLIDSIIQRIISHADIQATLAHVVYSSGGKFYMLLPNTKKVLQALKTLKKEIETEIWNQHNGQLIVNLDYVPFSYDNKNKGLCFENKKNQPIGELWRTLADKLTLQKNQKFKNIISENYCKLFEPQTVDEKSKVCAVTGIESSSCVAIDSREKEKTFVLPIVKKQSELGNTLKDADFIITYKGDGKNDYLNNRAKFHISCVGIDNYLFDRKELVDNNADFRTISSADVCRVKAINQSLFLVTLKGQKCGYGFQFYGGNKQAQISGYDKTFEELADNSYLGILRMDVDNLGKIFIEGLPDEDKSFAAYSTLSFMLDYFFSGYLNTIREKYKDDVNILYSGGDDVFAIGKWDRLIDFAEDIRKSFHKFVGREDISISGGITLVDEKFPIAKAAQMAGEAEDAAKKYKNSAKNAFNMFGESILWTEEEFGYVKNYKNQFVELIDNQNMSRGILHKLMIYAEMVKTNTQIEENLKNGIDDKRKTNMSYLWHTAYYLTRYIKQYDKNSEIKNFCTDLRDKQLSNTENYRLISLAARWAELTLRDKNEYKQ